MPYRYILFLNSVFQIYRKQYEQGNATTMQKKNTHTQTSMNILKITIKDQFEVIFVCKMVKSFLLFFLFFHVIEAILQWSWGLRFCVLLSYYLLSSDS